MIWNTDIAQGPGEHWVAVFLTGPTDPVSYFDSYGLPPILPAYQRFMMDRQCLYNPVTFQGLLSTVCGYYCLYVISLKCRGWGWEDILGSFPSTEMGCSDFYIRALVTRAFI